MRILITGGTGFIGDHLIKEISEVNQILLLTRNLDNREENNVHCIYGDLGEISTFDEKVINFNPDVLVHLAWQDIPDYSEETSYLNLINSISLIKFILKKTSCKKIIISGSCFEYGKLFGSCNEKDKVKINNYFAWAKNSLYDYVSVMTSELNINLVWFRIFYVFGKGQMSKSIIPYLTESIRNRKLPNVMYPNNKNDFIYVKDVARFFDHAIKHNIKSGIYNLGSGNSTPIYELVRFISEYFDNKKLLENFNVGDSSAKSDFWASMEKTKQVFKLDLEYDYKSGIKDYLKQLS